MWNGCVMTKLSARVEPKQMTSDYAIGLRPWTYHRPHYYSLKGAIETAALYAIPAWAAAFLVIAVARRRRLAAAQKRLRLLWRMALPVTAAVAIAGAAFAAAVPKIEVTGTGVRFPWLAPVGLHRGEEAYAAMLTDIETLDLAAIQARIAQAFAEKHATNAFTKAPLAMRDCPGDYTIFEDRGASSFGRTRGTAIRRTT